MLVKEDSNWLRFNGLTSAAFNQQWNVSGNATYTVLSSSGATYTVSNANHGHASGVNQFNAGATVNANTVFEYNSLTGSRDTNHYWHIWPSANGTYAIAEGVGGSRRGTIWVK